MRDYYAFDGHGFDEQKARVALLTLLRDPNLGRVWLILDGAVAAGYIVLCFGYSLEWLGRDAFVDEFFLREPYRGRGLGTQDHGFRGRTQPAHLTSRLFIWRLPSEYDRAEPVSEARLQRTCQHLHVEMDRAESLCRRLRCQTTVELITGCLCYALKFRLSSQRDEGEFPMLRTDDTHVVFSLPSCLVARFALGPERVLGRRWKSARLEQGKGHEQGLFW